MIKRLPIFFLLSILFASAIAQTKTDSLARHDDSVAKRELIDSVKRLPADSTKKALHADSVAKSVPVDTTGKLLHKDSVVKQPAADSVAKQLYGDTVIRSAPADTVAAHLPADSTTKRANVKHGSTGVPVKQAAVAGAAAAKSQGKSKAALPASGAAQKTSPLKTLSAEKYNMLLSSVDYDDMALAGELNHYPLPEKALKYQVQLGLNAAQVTKLKDIVSALHRKKLEMGNNIIRNEKMLDSLFHNKQIDDGIIIFYTNRYGLYQGELRNAVLQACYKTEAILSDAQIKKLESLEK